MNNRFSLGDQVRWVSGSRGIVQAKSGKVVAVIPPGSDVVEFLKRKSLQDRYRLDQISEWRDRRLGRKRKTFTSERYLVERHLPMRDQSKPLLYLPKTSSLRKP